MKFVLRRLLVLVSAALLICPGCSLFKGRLNPRELKQVDGKQKLAIVYRTESDRLNVVGGRSLADIRQVAYQQSPTSLLPPVSVSTLKVLYPHPAGRPDHAQVFVAFSPVGEDSAIDSASLLTKLTGLGAKSPAESTKPFEIWALDIPKYQIDGIVAKLQKDNFFRRSKVLNSKTYLGVSLDGKGFGKNYRNVDELDALVVRVRQHGWPVGPDGRPLQRRRPAPPRERAVYQARGERPLPPQLPLPDGRQPNYQPYPPQQPAEYQAARHPTYDRPMPDQPRYNQPTPDQPRYEQPRHDQRGNAGPYDHPGYDPQWSNDPTYNQPRYDARPPSAPAAYQQGPAR